MDENEKRERRRAYMRQYGRENYSLLHSLKLCVKCKAQDAYTLSGRIMCAECAEKSNAGRRAWRRKHGAEIQEEANRRNRERYWRRREQGLCVRCGKPSGEAQMCGKCKAKNNGERNDKHHREGMTPAGLRGKDGKCYFCVDAPAAEGFRVCEKCLERLREMTRNRQRTDNSGHYWRRDNRMIFHNT